MDFGPIVNLAERNPESLKAFFNAMPCFVGSGGYIDHISDDLLEVVVKVPLTDRTRNVVGTIYGGSMYGASDAIYMMLLWFQLGPEYLLFDKTAKVEYRRPGLSEVSARCVLDPKVLDDIRETLTTKSSGLWDFKLEFLDINNKAVCVIEKQVYVRKAG